MSGGYDVVCVDGTPKQGLSCVHCKLLLRNPVQTEEGVRLCKTCFHSITSLPSGSCDDCDVTLTPGSHFYPDKAVQREIMSILVFCRYKCSGCPWEGLLKKFEDHVADCEFKGVACPNEGCGQSFKEADLQNHLQECGFRLIKCNHCSATIQFDNIKKHELSCEELIITCDEESCSSTFKRKELNLHKENECSVISCLTCNTKVLRATGVELAKQHSAKSCPEYPLSAASPKPSQSISSVRGMDQGEQDESLTLEPSQIPPESPPERVHLSLPLQNFMHHQDVAKRFLDLQSEMQAQKSLQESSAKEIATLKDEQSEVEKELSSVKKEVSNIRQSMLDMERKSSSSQGQSYDKLKSQLDKLVEEDEEKTTQMKDLMEKLEAMKTDNSVGFSGSFGKTDIDHIRSGISRKGVGSMDSYTSLDSGYVDSTQTKQMRLMDDFQKQLGTMRVQLSELELQLQASLASTHNGNFLWRIPEVTRRRRDAINSRVTSIYSPPFYTGRNGYKMCIRAYLNGDGMGYQSHLSLFFVIMRGECDPLLKWPFEYKVSMILVDQTHRKHVVQTFKPTPESNSFQRPKTDMNVASGCPQFAKLNLFDDPSYVKDDVMYIKCIVDTSKIFHP